MVTNLCYSLFLVHLENSVLFIERLNPIMVLSSEITKEEGFTLAGVLMFGKKDAITDTECCPNFFPDYREKILLALNAACIDGYVTNESLRVVVDIHKAEIADLLKDMCQDGLLVQDGYGRGTKYYLPNDDSNITSNIASSDSNITCSGSNIPSNIASSGSKVASLSSNIPSSNISISNMESLRKKKKLSFEELKKLICLVCSDWQSLDELALQVNRNKTYLKIYVIPRMLADKSLEMMFPGVPKRPRQKYKSIVNK